MESDEQSKRNIKTWDIEYEESEQKIKSGKNT